MPYVLNALDKEVTVKVFGRHFTFAPKQIKAFENDAMAFKMTTDLAEEGLVDFPSDVFERGPSDPEYQTILKEKIVSGKTNRIRKLTWLRNNETISLQKDLDIKGLKSGVNPYIAEHPKLVAQLRELDTLLKEEREQQRSLETEVENLLRNTDGNAIATNAGTPNKGSSDIPKSAKS